MRPCPTGFCGSPGMPVAFYGSPHTVIEGIWIETPLIRAIAKTLTQSLGRSGTAAEPDCRRVEGDAGTGKSFLSRHFVLQHPPFTNGDSWFYPVIWMEAPVSREPLACARALLKALGVEIPEGSRITVDAAVDRICERIRILHVRAIVVDELQQMLEGKENEVKLMQTANMIKTIINRTGVPFFVFGLPYAERILKLDPQLRSRFRSPLVLPNFDYRTETPRRLFTRFLHEVDVRLPFPVRSGLAETEKALPIYQSGSGNLRLTMTLIRKGAFNAIADDAERIEMRHLEQAFETEMREATGPAFPNPFRTLPSPQNLVSPGSWVEVASIWARVK